MTDLEKIATIKQNISKVNADDVLWLISRVESLRAALIAEQRKNSLYQQASKTKWTQDHDYLEYEEDDRR